MKFSLTLLGPRSSPLSARSLNGVRLSTREGVSFNKNFPSARKSKAWDGQDRDKYFQKNFAHVHARQKTYERRLPDSQHESHYVDDFGNNSRKNSDYRSSYRSEGRSDFISYKSFKSRNPHVEYIYGTSSVLAALEENKRQISKLNVLEGIQGLNSRIISLAKENNIEIDYNASRRTLNEITDNGVHNGYVIETRALDLPEISSLGSTSSQNQFVVNEVVFQKIQEKKFEMVEVPHKYNAIGIYIDQVTDPHNIGAIIRSAYFLGADFVVVSEKNCAKLSAVASKTSAGALEVLPIYFCQNPLAFFEKSVDNGWGIIASVVPELKLSKGMRLDADELSTIQVDQPCLLAVGSESEGLRKSLLNRCTHVVSIPSARNHPVADSLNVSVASALLLSKFFNH